MLFLGGDLIEAGLFSLRLGNKAALTCHRHVIHSRGDTSLPDKGGLGLSFPKIKTQTSEAFVF